jgi:hypothetical protein
MKKTHFYCFILLCICLAATAIAEVPQMINYQGRLTGDTGNPLDTTVSMAFTIYDDSTGGSTLWSETHSTVTVTGGLFNVILGSISPIGADIFTDPDRYLGITVGGDSEIVPRTRLISVGYACYAQRTDTAAYAETSGDAASGWTDDGSVVHLSAIDDSVGIGTATPEFKLDVAGDLRCTHLYSNASGGVFWLYAPRSAATPGAAFKVSTKDAFDAYLQRLNISGGEDEANFNIINSNVGINTWDPLSRLHVEGKVRADGYFAQQETALMRTVDDERMRITGGTTFAFLNDGIRGSGIILQGKDYGGTDAGGDLALYAMSGKSINFRHVSNNGSPTERMILDADGRFGIGTTSPDAKLHVMGGIYSEAGEPHVALRQDGKRRFAAYVHADGDQFRIARYNNDGNYVASPFVIDRTSGRVGVSNLNPAYTLDVGGSVNATTYYGDGSNLTGVGGTADNDWTINGNDIYHLTGNVGIGRTSPAYRLDVDGDLMCRGTTGGGIRAYRMDIAPATWGAGGPVVFTVTGNQAYNTNPLATFEQQSSSVVTSVVEVDNAGTGNGIYAESNATASNRAALHGRAKADGGSGVYGETWSLGVSEGSSCAVFGWAPAGGEAVGGAALGVLGKVNSYQDPGNSSVPAGVFGWATATSGICAGLYGQCDSNDGFGVYSKGKLQVDGDINTNGTITAGSSASQVGIGTYFPSRILTVVQHSSTDPIADAWTSYSSRRWKENIAPLEHALEKVCLLQGVSFDWKDTKKHDIGMIAEDVGAVLPELVVFEENKTDAQSIDYARLTSVLVEAIKELSEQNKELQLRIEQLETQQ